VPAKVQSALLEGMQERQVTIGLETHALPNPLSSRDDEIRSIPTHLSASPSADGSVPRQDSGTYPSAEEEMSIAERFVGMRLRVPYGSCASKTL